MPTEQTLARLRARSEEELLAAVPLEKTCRSCGETKPGAEFARDRSKPDGCDTRCRPCAAESMRRYRLEHPDRVRATKRRTYQKNYPKVREYRLKRLYGLTRSEYDALLAAQSGRCKICGRTETHTSNGGDAVRELAVDHCHDTGQVRGLLCGRCNSAIGLLGHDEELLLAAVRYLRESEASAGVPAGEGGAPAG